MYHCTVGSVNRLDSKSSVGATMSDPRGRETSLPDSPKYRRGNPETSACEPMSASEMDRDSRESRVVCRESRASRETRRESRDETRDERRETRDKRRDESRE